jgi:phosphopantetheinyl transferase
MRYAPRRRLQVWCVRLSRDRELVLRARSFLGKDERVRADEFHLRELGDDFVMSRGLLRVLLSRKEAFVKALGDGFSIPLDSFQVSLAPGHDAALLHVRDTPGEERAWRIHAFSPASRFSDAVALRDRWKRIRVHRADAREIFVAAGFL